MTNIIGKLEKQSISLQKKIDALSGDYLTNTRKRQEEQRHRHNMIDRYSSQKQVIDFLTSECQNRDLTPFEQAITVSTFYDEMRSLLSRKQYSDEKETQCNFMFPSNDSKLFAKLKKAGINSLDEMMDSIASFDVLVKGATIPIDPKVTRLRDLIYKARLYQVGDVQFTPEVIAKQVVDLAELNADSLVLEPEAGIAYIADEVKKITANVDCIEVAPSFREILKLKGHNLIGDDFIECDALGTYDAVVMNVLTYDTLMIF